MLKIVYSDNPDADLPDAYEYGVAKAAEQRRQKRLRRTLVVAVPVGLLATLYLFWPYLTFSS